MTLTSRLLSDVCDEMLQVGADWSIRTDDSCTWCPHDLAQHNTTRPITDRGDDDGVLLAVETNLLVGVPPEYPEARVRLNTLNADNALSTLALGDDGLLRTALLGAGLRRHLRLDESRWVARLCVCQVADALNLAAAALVVYPRAQRVCSEHPTSGRRSDVDDVDTGGKRRSTARSASLPSPCPLRWSAPSSPGGQCRRRRNPAPRSLSRRPHIPDV